MMTDPAGLGDRLRELGAEVAVLATGRDAGLWLYALEALARQADEMERDRAARRGQVARVRAEAASWGPLSDGDMTQWNATVWAITWCHERIRVALDGERGT